jgi:HEAT repeat protein
MELLCNLLLDPEIDVQNKAIDAVIRANDPDTIKYLIPVLKNENENARRAAVEVLNEVGDAKSVKELLEAVSDDDWWVRSRAADALGKIGGPKVVDAVLHLVGDQDEDIRRTAVEILNQTKDAVPSAISSMTPRTRTSGSASAPWMPLPKSAASARCHGCWRCSRTLLPDRCRWSCARLAASATTRSSTPSCRCSAATRRRSGSRQSPRWRNSPMSVGSSTFASRSRAILLRMNRPWRRRPCARCQISTRASR